MPNIITNFSINLSKLTEKKSERVIALTFKQRK